LRPSQRLEYDFVGISGHLTSFLKCSHDLFVRDTMARLLTCARRRAKIARLVRQCGHWPPFISAPV
jgi:hypothetical protein